MARLFDHRSLFGQKIYKNDFSVQSINFCPKIARTSYLIRGVASGARWGDGYGESPPPRKNPDLKKVVRVPRQQNVAK